MGDAPPSMLLRCFPRALVALVVTGAFASACGLPPDPPRPVVQVRLPVTRYEATEGARTMFFRAVLVNPADTALVVTAFAFAADRRSEPPACALYPPRAATSMPHPCRFAIGVPRLGQRLVLPAGDSVVFDGALPIPSTWFDGRAIASPGFETLTVAVYGEDGKTLALREDRL